MRAIRKEGLNRLPGMVLASAVFVLVFTILFSWLIFDHVPHINDEIANVFQAQIFSLGKLFVPSPDAKENFDFTHIINNGKWYSHYPPGHPLLLVLGIVLGAPWLINPLLAALTVLLLYFLGKELYGRRTGILAAFLASVSIWFLVMSSSMMSHTSCLFFITVFLLFFFRGLKRPTAINGLLAGAGLGMAFIIRPHPAVFFALPFLAYLVVLFFMSPRLRWKNIVCLGAVAICFLGLFLAYNWATNGHPLTMGYEISHGEGHGMGFGKSGYMDIPHSPQKGSEQLGLYLEEMNNRMFGWPLSSFLALIPLLWGFRLKDRDNRHDLLLFTGFLCLFTSLFFYWGTCVLIGARMVFEALPVFLLLTARGIERAPTWLTGLFPKLSEFRAKKGTAAVLAVFILFAFAYRLPRWVKPPITQWYCDGFANYFERVNPALHPTLNEALPENSLVVMQFLYHPMEYFPQGWWGSGFQHNGPKLDGPIIYATHIPGELPKLRASYPARRIYLYYGTLEKGMLFPVRETDLAADFTKPQAPGVSKHGRFALIDDPREFFTLYSQEFSDFVSRIFEHKDYSKIDVKHLLEQGTHRFNHSQFQEAAFYYEAALQIEKAPNEREIYLNMLSKCYFKLGLFQEARAISERLQELDYKKYYNILPARGI